MRCPFLREAQVKSCRAAAYRKFIVRHPGQPDAERCSSASYVDCPVAKQHIEDSPSVDHCPFLHESLVQYCAAAPVPKFIPYSESELSRCTTGGYAYCELYAELEHAGSSPEPASDGRPVEPDPVVDGIPVPGRLWYTPNHLWLDVSADGTYHVGVDGFLARTLGAVDSLTFLTMSGLQRPAVVLSVHGVDLQLAFPAEISIRKANTYLRTNPSKLLADPYGSGWLFEGKKARPTSEECVPAGLIAGSDAPSWIGAEVKCLHRFVRELSEHPDARGNVWMADGGDVQHGVCQALGREEILRLYAAFFSSYTLRREASR
jgi:glycine cleavage system H lipoate-binding protein